MAKRQYTLYSVSRDAKGRKRYTRESELTFDKEHAIHAFQGRLLDSAMGVTSKVLELRPIRTAKVQGTS